AEEDAVPGRPAGRLLARPVVLLVDGEPRAAGVAHGPDRGHALVDALSDGHRDARHAPRREVASAEVELLRPDDEAHGTPLARRRRAVQRDGDPGPSPGGRDTDAA